MTTHSDTPRTDALYHDPNTTRYALASEMRFMERELAALSAKYKQAREYISELQSEVSHLATAVE